MNKDTLDAFMTWGDRANRDTAALMDLVIAGSIDHLKGHGTVRLMPSRLEEIADRIGERRRDPDGAWIVTLDPPEDSLVAVNPYDVLAYVHEFQGQENDAEEVRNFVQAAAKPGITLRDLAAQGYEGFVEWLATRHHEAVDPRDALEPYHNPDGIDNQSD